MSALGTSNNMGKIIEGKSIGLKSTQLQNENLVNNNMKSLGIKSKQPLPTSSVSPSPQVEEKNSTSGIDANVKAMGPYEQCNICSKLCDRTGHIQCAECDNFHICLTCYCSGLENVQSQDTAFVPTDKVYNHKNNHKYIPIGANNMPLFTRDWTAEQELLLLEGLSKYGLGNWKEISELVNMSNGYPKSANNCQKHYYQVYINSANPPLPDLNSVILPDKNQTQSIYFPIDDEPADVTTAPPETNSQSSVNKPQTFGYWPLRGDFDVEYDNDAELILADMEFRDDDTPQQKELKLSVIEIYNSKLDERIYRKRIIIERGLLDSKTMQQKDKKLTSEERELSNILRPFNRFHSPESHEQLIQLLIQERKIRSRLYQLLLWKSLGLESIQDIYEYEENRASKRRHFENASRIITSIGVKEKNAKAKNNFSKENLSTLSTKLDAKAQIISECLEEKEIEFCTSYAIPPIVFFMAKRVLLEEIATNPFISVDQTCKSLELDVVKHGRLFDFILNLTPHVPFNQDSELEPVVDLSALPLDNLGKIDPKHIASEIYPPS